MNNSTVEAGVTSGLISFTASTYSPPKPRKELTPKQLRELLSSRKKGVPLHALAKRFGIHHQTVSAICDYNKVKPTK